MTIRSILTSHTGSGADAAALHLAVQAAQAYDAHLSGVVWQARNPMRNRVGAYFTKEIDQILDQAESEYAQERRAEFDAAVQAAGLADRADFSVLTYRSGSIAETARGHDIIVMGGAVNGRLPDEYALRPDVIALRSGRPVVIVPSGYNAPEISTHAVLAWDGKRAAARALSDAMHILGTKSRVTLLAIGENVANDYGADVMRLMQLHGITAERVAMHPQPGGVGNTILNACSDLGAGLLIMGAYEHSKFAEDILGGVTRDILEHATLPVLMSH